MNSNIFKYSSNSSLNEQFNQQNFDQNFSFINSDCLKYQFESNDNLKNQNQFDYLINQSNFNQSNLNQQNLNQQNLNQQNLNQQNHNSFIPTGFELEIYDDTVNSNEMNDNFLNDHFINEINETNLNYELIDNVNNFEDEWLIERTDVNINENTEYSQMNNEIDNDELNFFINNFDRRLLQGNELMKFKEISNSKNHHLSLSSLESAYSDEELAICKYQNNESINQQFAIESINQSNDFQNKSTDLALVPYMDRSIVPFISEDQNEEYLNDDTNYIDLDDIKENYFDPFGPTDQNDELSESYDNKFKINVRKSLKKKFKKAKDIRQFLDGNESTNCINSNKEPNNHQLDESNLELQHIDLQSVFQLPIDNYITLPESFFKLRIDMNEL